MKKILVLIAVAFATFSCSNEPVSLNSEANQNSNSLNAKPSASTSNWEDYSISVSVSQNGSLWTYTITRAKTNAKDLSHFILDINNCGNQSATFANIVWATVNGSPANLSQSEGSGTNCNPQSITSNFVKFDNLQSASSWVLVLKFDRGFSVVNNAIGWIKAGNSCNQGIISAPGCPIGEECSFSQGFFFANGSFNNGANVFWVNGLTIGGVNYSHAQGNSAWNIDRGPGGDQTMNGFFQLGAVRLSNIEGLVAADVAIIETYFTGLNVFSLIITTTGNNPYSYFNLPQTSNGISKSQVSAAGGRIGSFIDANHCGANAN
ncbi:MAG: hypothetical protein ACI924_002148 [Flavobacterium sp.]|jgi:hypothetical protein